MNFFSHYPFAKYKKAKESKNIKKVVLVLLFLFAIGTGIYIAYNRFIAPTNIAVVNMPEFKLQRMHKANNNSFVKFEKIADNEYHKLTKYNFIIIRGHGVNFSPEQTEYIKKAAVEGALIYVCDVTNPECDFTNLTGENLDKVSAYMENGGTKNYRSLCNYIRKYIDKKIISAPEPEALVEISGNYLFHIEDGVYLKTVAEYEKYYRNKGFYKKGQPKIALLSSNINPNNSNRDHFIKFIQKLEERNLNVYPVFSFSKKRLEFLKEINPDLVILQPHGRLAMGQQEKAVEWLKEQNIPLLSPIAVFSEYNEWVKYPQGLAGGMLSMSIVLPEIDGAVAPYAITAQFKDENGYKIFDAIPKRMDDFCDMVSKWMTLHKKQNHEKKVAIYYFKGPGQNAMVASNMEVVPSLYNVLKKLKVEGYKVENLPETKEEFEKLIMQKGPVLGAYAIGTFQEYLKTGMPALVQTTEYEKWCKNDMPEELYNNVVEKYGLAPGKYMAVEQNGKNFIAVTRIQFGNICILPQPLPGIGDDSQKLVHGAKVAPPHTYIASYLWTRHKFKADAIIHFGTHGSLEFTPGKQVALSCYDWPDVLIGNIPHSYIYTISNIGEGIIAKRRTYARLITYLTPPFMESGTYGELDKLNQKLDKYNLLSDGSVREQYAQSIKKIVTNIGIDKDLGLDNIKNYSSEDIHKIHEYLEEIEEEKVTGGLYTLGQYYTSEQTKNTARLMATDPIAYSLAELDVQKGKITPQNIQDRVFFNKNYLSKAKKIVAKVQAGANTGQIIKNTLSKEDIEKAHKWQKAQHQNSMGAVMGQMIELVDNKRNILKKEILANDTTILQLKEIMVKVIADPEKKEFITSLKSEKVFKKAIKMADPLAYKKAMKIAKRIKSMSPEMYKNLIIAGNNDIQQLLIFMQNEELKNKTFKLLDSKTLTKEVEQEKQKILKQKTEKCLSPEYIKNFKIAFSPDFKDKINKLSKEELKNLVKSLEWYKNNTKALDYLKESQQTGAKEIIYLYKQDSWNEKCQNAIQKADKLIVKLERKEALYAKAVLKIETNILSISKYEENLLQSTNSELNSTINSLNGGFVSPSSGGDPIANPFSLPTGRNMYSIDAERTPSPEAWNVGVKLAKSLLKEEKRIKGRYPKKISFTLWSTSFISTEGATIAQILYLLGVEPIRDAFGRVQNLRLIPVEELGRPRIDVVVQTSGQLRDLAASRLYLINKAVDMAAKADDAADSLNYVKSGVLDAERVMVEKGISPRDARRLSALRVFGGVNGNYGTGIMGLVEDGDSWEDEEQIAQTYINNMGALYGQGDDWGKFIKGAFEAALQNTEVVVQPRQSNTWGALSLDHVYEFMGGMNLAVRHVTGNDPTAYFNDFRNVSNPRMQELKEAIGVEARSTIFNPKYIKEYMKGEASSAEHFAETFRNTYGWNVMKPQAIDKYIWENYYDIYVKDNLNLNIHKFFNEKNPYALQEMTAVMLETVRKGYWKASIEQIREMAKLHAQLIKEHNAGCSGFVCDNTKLKDFISKNIDEKLKQEYNEKISDVKELKNENADKSLVLEKEEIQQKKQANKQQNKFVNNWIVILGSIIGLVLLIVFVIKRRN